MSAFFYGGKRGKKCMAVLSGVVGVICGEDALCVIVKSDSDVANY